jgi:hypothetical protein
MSKSEYQTYAHEYLEWARTSKTAEQQQSFLELARTWMVAANEAEGHKIEHSIPMRQ